MREVITKDQRRVEVNYTTFARDLEWMDYSLRSFRKYTTGFSGVTIVVPTVDVEKFLPLEKRYSTPDCPVWIKNFIEYPGKGFVHHLAMKMYADVFHPNATHVLHMDPDSLWIAPATPEDYFVDDKPVLLIEPYESIKKYHAGRFHWKEVTEGTLKFNCDYETMCRHPAVHCRWLYRELRDYIEKIHVIPFENYCLKQKNSFPQSLGEFNSLGAFALEKHKDEYHFINRGYDEEASDPNKKVLQLWSYTGVRSPENQREIKKYLG